MRVRLGRPYVIRASHMGLFEKAGELQEDVFEIEIVVDEDRDKLRNGTVVPIDALDVYVRPVLARLNRKRLDQLEPREAFEPLVSCPTAEHLALYLYDSLLFLGNDGRQRFVGVRVRENGGWWVEVPG